MDSAAPDGPTRDDDASAEAELREITPRALAELVRGKRLPVLIDVREPHEYAYARIAGARLIPLATLPDEIGTLPEGANIVVYCHHGIRSGHAVDMLRSAGIHARNLTGGIDRWSAEVDSSVRRY